MTQDADYVRGEPMVEGAEYVPRFSWRGGVGSVEWTASVSPSWWTTAQLARVIVYLGEIAQGPFPEDVQDCIEWAKQADESEEEVTDGDG